MAEPLSYKGALQRLLSVPSSPRLGLGRMERLLGGLGDPQRGRAAIHVAATNGKGSTLAFLDAIAAAAGVRRGLTTSPHLSSATERIRIDGLPLDRDVFRALEAQVASVAAAMGDDPPTFFERIIAMAWLAFAEADVDLALVEVGLGGRLDATNVIEPVACGIGRIGLDHQAFLGDTLGAIAREKAGIAKPGIPAVVLRQTDEACDAIEAEVARRNAPLRWVDPIDTSVSLGLSGGFQRENAGLALALAEAAGLGESEAARLAALASARWPGRLEAMGPRTWVDGAHNPDAAAALRRVLDDEAPFRGRPLAVILGATRGHDPDPFAQALGLQRGLGPVFAVSARAPRSVPALEVGEALRAAGLEPRVRSVADALDEAEAWASGVDGLVLVTGSLYLVGEVRALRLGLDEDPALPLF